MRTLRGSAVAILLALASLAACDRTATPPATEDVGVGSGAVAAVVSGTVAYRERMALSPGAIVEVSLLDVSRQDVAAKVLATQKITNPGQVPVAFELAYDPAQIDERMSYSVQAKIFDHGELLFISDTRAPVLTRGAGNHVDMRLVRVQRPPATTDPAGSGMELTGMFSYMADAALFRDCRTGKSYPVAMEGAYMELESAYLNSGNEPGSEVMTELRGRYLERSSPDIKKPIIMLIVDSLKAVYPDETCAPTEHAALHDTRWRLVEVGGEAVTMAEGVQEANMVLESADSRVHGNAGCNDFFGQYEAGDERIRFSALGSTMKACLHGMDTERAFLDVLEQATGYRISGQFLELYDGDRRLARFEAVYL